MTGVQTCALPIYVVAAEKDMERVESILNKNIYFDDAIEVYINQKVQLLYEKVNLILQEPSAL